jgi:flagellin-like protein
VAIILSDKRMLKSRNKPNSGANSKKRFTLNEKALSPIFATLIILAVVTILFIPVFIWATGTSSQTEESWQTSGLIATERIVIEEVNLKAGSPTCSIYVRNIGKTTLTINNVLISPPDSSTFTYEKAKGELSTVNPVTGNPQQAIIQGELIEIKITNLKGLTLSSNQVYTVKVYTVRGVGEAYQVVT